jgi:dTDP-4-dehydrorhamnose reductase
MRILVTGASGLLGINLCLTLADAHAITGLVNRQRIENAPFKVMGGDLREAAFLRKAVEKAKPQAIIHCAAAAHIDWCEQHPDEAVHINAEVPGSLAEICLKRDIPLLHVSTDAVFDGKQVEYTEEDEPNPQSVYARSKYLGEQNVLAVNPKALVSRVNFFGFSLSGTRSLAEFFINNLSAGSPVNGFVDVIFCPLYVKDLADLFVLMLEKSLSGIYHTVSSESLSKYAFGLNIAKKFGFDRNLINPISVNEGNLVATRSPLLMLNVEKLSAAGITPPGQEQGLWRLHQDYLEGWPARIREFVLTE